MDKSNNKAEILGRSLRERSVIEKLGVREAQLSGDQQTQELLGKIAKLQEDIIMKQQSGSFTLQDLKPLKDLQVQIQERKVFREYSDAYVQASAFFKRGQQGNICLPGF